MKTLLCIAGLLAVVTLQGQNNVINTCPFTQGGYMIFLSPNNNTDSCKKYANIDQTQPQNIWQVGHVNKTVFTTGYNGGTKALVTDTVNPYPANNVSSFTLKLTSCFPGMCCNWGAQVSFTHKYNTETGMDGGTIEYSTDAGLNWSNVVQNSGMCWSGIYSVSNAVSSLSQPGFSGTSNGWVTSQLMLDFNGMTASTTWLRFTFGSNGSVSGDGWMIGDLQVMDISEGIEAYGNTRVVAVSPNPVHNELALRSQVSGSILKELSVFDNSGRAVIHHKEFKGSKLDVFSLPAGFYTIRYTEGDMNTFSRFVKQ